MKDDFGFTEIQFEDTEAHMDAKEYQKNIKEMYDLIDVFIKNLEKNTTADVIKWPATARFNSLKIFRSKLSDIMKKSNIDI